jgi:hypothetical protein
MEVGQANGKAVTFVLISVGRLLGTKKMKRRKGRSKNER